MLERRTLCAPAPVVHERRRSDRDRRGSQRYATNGATALLTWQKGEGYGVVEVSLRDISQGGVSGFADVAPPADLPIWFRLRADDTSAWLGVTIVGICRTGLLGTGPRLVRVRFHEPCPYELFKAAIGGLLRERSDDEYARGGLKARDGFQ